MTDLAAVKMQKMLDEHFPIVEEKVGKILQAFEESLKAYDGSTSDLLFEDYGWYDELPVGLLASHFCDVGFYISMDRDVKRIRATWIAREGLIHLPGSEWDMFRLKREPVLKRALWDNIRAEKAVLDSLKAKLVELLVEPPTPPTSGVRLDPVITFRFSKDISQESDMYKQFLEFVDKCGYRQVVLEHTLGGDEYRLKLEATCAGHMLKDFNQRVLASAVKRVKVGEEDLKDE